MKALRMRGFVLNCIGGTSLSSKAMACTSSQIDALPSIGRRRWLGASLALGSGMVLVGAKSFAADVALRSNQTAEEWREGQRRYFSDVTLIDQTGGDVRLFSDVLDGYTVLVHAFYGTCKDACPVQFGKIRKLLAQLPAATREQVRIASISVDPMTDDVEALAAMAAKFDASAPSWRVLTGTSENIALALRKFGLSAPAREAHNPSFIIGQASQARWQKVPGTASVQELVTRLNSWSRVS